MVYVALFARLLIAGILAFSAGAKLRRIEGFAVTVRDLLGLPLSAARVAAWLVIAGELTAAALALGPASAVVGLSLAAGLLACFAAVAIRAAQRQVGVPCRCFGAPAGTLGIPHAVRNGALVAVAALGVVATVKSPADTPHPVAVGMVVMLAAVGVALVVLFDDLVDLFANPTDRGA
jgi:hypothetical protein